jgi:hypothetical protein
MEVPGLREALVTLKKLDATIYQSMVTNLDTVTAPMRQAIQSNIPSIAPLSGFVHKGRTKWPNGKVSVRTNVKRRKSRRGGQQAVIRIIVKNAAVEIADMAGIKNDVTYGKQTRDYKYKGGIRRHTVNGQGASMISALNSIGKASRFVWPAANRYKDTVSVEVNKVVQTAIIKGSEELRKRYA